MKRTGGIPTAKISTLGKRWITFAIKSTKTRNTHSPSATSKFLLTTMVYREDITATKIITKIQRIMTQKEIYNELAKRYKQGKILKETFGYDAIDYRLLTVYQGTPVPEHFLLEIRVAIDDKGKETLKMRIMEDVSVKDMDDVDDELMFSAQITKMIVQQVKSNAPEMKPFFHWLGDD